ncbi:efflux RND transporter periplasmic adaptor subunit [Pseudopedobacter saltans]|nr:efflux RND transporter periplasmic adaptor subunit [Pseudopedobacter saltans]
MILRIPIPLFVLAVIVSCNNTETTDSDNVIQKSPFQKTEVVVQTVPVKTGVFNQEIISNGKVFAENNAEIKFPVYGAIQQIFVKNGQRISKGQLLATLDDTDLRNKFNRIKEALEKAQVDLDDRLIDYGYRLKDSTKVPADIMKMARIKSGYASVRFDYAEALASLGKTRIIAPFSGKIANMEAREFNTSDNFRKLCTLIDDSRLNVEFNVLETEYHSISKGSAIEVSPYGSNISVKGIVSDINPLIDDNGMIKITGVINNIGENLLNGMSVKVIIKKGIPEQMFIPKQAVLQRQDRQVVFTYENGRSKWNYVETELQNTHLVTIKSGLKNGQQVIISNNFNLAHDAEVILDDSKSEPQ